MANEIRTHYKVFDGTTWVTYWFITSADAVYETDNRKFVTSAQKNLLNLGTNVANGLLKLNSSAKIDVTHIPDLSSYYAKLTSGKISASAIPDLSSTYSLTDHDHNGIYEPVITKNSGFNLNLASTSQAEAGTANNVLMTPLRTKQAIEELAPAPADATESIKGIVKLSSDFNPTTADANTALSQAGAKALKAYADTVAGMGFRPQEPCSFAIVGTDANGISLSGTLSGTVQVGDRVLVSGRTNKAENGIYTVNSGAWTKDPESVKSGATTFILKEYSSGTNDTIWWYSAAQQEYVLFSRVDVAQDSAQIGVSMQENSYQLFIKSDAISTSHIGNGQVTEAKLATNAVTTNKIKDGNVTTAKLADDAVTTDKINDSAVTADKLGPSSVLTAKINNGAVTADKLASNAVTNVKINNNAVTSAKIADGAVTEAKLATSVKELIKKITVGTTTPSNPNVGDVWLDTSVS